jgi:hypothetical protein
MPKPLPFLNRDWRQSAQQYADDRGFGPLERLPHEQWQAVLRHVELQLRRQGLTYSAIGERLGTSPDMARQRVTRHERMPRE